MHPCRAEVRGAGGALLALAALIAGCASPSPAPAGERVDLGELRLLDLEGAAVAPLAESPKPAVCLLLVRIDCPISNRYAPEVRRLATLFAADVDFRLVYSDADETSEMVRAHAADYDYPFPALRDPEQRLRTLVGARVTPEAAVFDADRRLVYVGRIDDLYADFGKTRARPRTRDLEQVLAELAAGEAPPFRRTRAIGCPLPDPAP